MSSQARKTMRFKSWGLLAISCILPNLMIDSVLNSAHAAEQNAGSQPDLVTGEVIPVDALPDDTTPIKVQWNVGNQGQGSSQPFKDKLQVFFVGKESNACPGNIPPSGNPVAESEVDEHPLIPGQVGQTQEVTVGPFEEGSYLFYVTVNSDQGESNESNFDNNSSYNCIYIKKHL